MLHPPLQTSKKRSREDDDRVHRLALAHRISDLADGVRANMIVHRARIEELEKEETALRKAGLWKNYVALARILADVNKRFETLNASGAVWVDYV